ncbi:hypothetical protein AAG906_031404 [Vitis piasezkii]
MFNLTFWFELGGNSKSIKETVESIDEENRSITFKVLDGELLNDYKSYNEDGSDPRGYLELAVNITKDIESHLLNA